MGNGADPTARTRQVSRKEKKKVKKKTIWEFEHSFVLHWIIIITAMVENRSFFLLKKIHN